jgi:GH18 family chitinase
LTAETELMRARSLCKHCIEGFCYLATGCRCESEHPAIVEVAEQVKSGKLRVDVVLEQMLETFRDRNSTYKDNWKSAGDVMAALFPQGIKLQTKADHIKFAFLNHIVGKLTRFVAADMAHTDSIHDLAVYAAMMEAFLKLRNGE